MKNIFNSNGSLNPVTCFIAIAVAIILWGTYAGFTGWRLFTFGSQQQWSAAGPRGHK